MACPCEASDQASHTAMPGTRRGAIKGSMSSLSIPLEAISRRVREGRMTGSSRATQPDGHSFHFG